MLVLLACVIFLSPNDSFCSLLAPVFALKCVPRTVQNGSEQVFPHMSALWQDRSFKPHKTELAHRKEKELLRDLGLVGGGWGPYCSQLGRDDRNKLSAREKVKLDVEFAKLKLESKDRLADLLLGFP